MYSFVNFDGADVCFVIFVLANIFWEAYVDFA